MRIALALAVVGCSAPSKPPLSHKTAEVARCLPAQFRRAAIAQFRADGERATLCYQAVEERDGTLSPKGYEPDDYRCFTIDERGAVVGEVPWQSPGQEPEVQPTHTIAWTSGTTYDVCTGSRCVPVTAQHAPGPLAHAAIVSADGKRAFTLHTRPGKTGDEIWGELIDVGAGHSIAELRVSDDDGAFTDTSTTRPVAIFGDKVTIGIFHAGPCCGTWLFDTRTGGRTALHDWDGSHVPVDDHTLLVLPGREDHAASLVDLATSTDVKSLTIPGAGYGEDSELSSLAVLALPHAVVIAHAQPAGIAIVDPSTRTLRPGQDIPICSAEN